MGGGAGGVAGATGVVAGVVGAGVGEEHGAGELVEWAEGEARGRVLGEGHPVLAPRDGDGRVAPPHGADHLHPLPLAGLPEAKGNDGGRNYSSSAYTGRPRERT